jgi:Flp pilus assembly pilin Flp
MRGGFAMLEKICRLQVAARGMARKAVRGIATGADDSGQGTTEYAILVGVIVVIAIVAIALFRDKLQELWNSIAEGINSL